MLFTDPLVLIDSMGALAPAELDGLIEALARPELRPTPAHDLARVSALAARFGHDHDPATLDEALRTYATCTYRGLARGRVGRSLILLRLKAGMAGQPFDAGQIHAMIDDAGEDPAMPGSAAALRVLTDALSALGDDPRYDRDDALRRLDAMASEVPPDSPLAGLVPLMRTALAVKRGGEGGVYSDASAAAEHARSLLSLPDLGSSERLHAEAMLAAAEGMRAAQHGEAGEAASAILRLSELTDRLPADDPAAAPYRSLLRDATGATTAGDAAEPGLSAGERTWRRWMAATAVLQPAMDRQDAAELARGVRMLREAADTAPPGYPHTATIDTMLGGLLCARFQLGAGRPALAEGLRRLESARALAGHPGHPAWTSNAMQLGLAYRLDGRTSRGREVGHEALRGHAWSVLLQAGTADAAGAARHAAGDAKQVARWCLADGDVAGAATALDAGRCLMLYAATVTMDVPSRLRGLGRTDLVARWARDAADADLRAEVLAALTGAPLSEAAVPDVLDPPSAAEVAGALAELRADALVYLLPGDDQGPGCAVFVPAGRRPSHLTLPRLTVGAEVTRHVDVLASRDAGAVAGQPREKDRLDRLCDWAWLAAIGPMLDELDRWRIGRAPRLVLVPMGDLAAVPWHAARDRDGLRAVEVATFSYAASARLLCQNAERPPVDAQAPALMVGDPTGDLPDALAEAAAIRTAFYPSATVLEGAAATPARVRDWLLAGGGALLHLACHGAVRSGVDGSHLSLAGGVLSARDILETRRATAVGVVALAACTTGVPSGAYDEAFSLTTAFLAAGARSVFGSLWPVPSDATSLLMFMAHHYLRADGKRPVDALNHAQRWMLDPDRAVPPTMPGSLAARVPELTGDVTAWAGFTHQGR